MLIRSVAALLAIAPIACTSGDSSSDSGVAGLPDGGVGADGGQPSDTCAQNPLAAQQFLVGLTDAGLELGTECDSLPSAPRLCPYLQGRSDVFSYCGRVPANMIERQQADGGTKADCTTSWHSTMACLEAAASDCTPVFFIKRNPDGYEENPTTAYYFMVERPEGDCGFDQLAHDNGGNTRLLHCSLPETFPFLCEPIAGPLSQIDLRLQDCSDPADSTCQEN